MNKSVDYEMWKERYHIYKWGLQKEKEEWGEEIEYRTKIKNAKKMLIDNITPELVVKYTELPLKEVLKIKKSLIKL